MSPSGAADRVPDVAAARFLIGLVATALAPTGANSER
jgi:hypothetical protein